MILFYYGLQLAGMHALANRARDALAKHHKVIITSSPPPPQEEGVC